MEWKDVKVIPDPAEHVSKYVFSNDTAVAEAVLYRYPDYKTRTVICCSTQSGCPMGCRFCGSGDYFNRSLTEAEIVAQPARLLADVYLDHGVSASDMKRLQIMFMSMGEPLLNLKELIPALHRLYAMFPTAALLISTSAPRVDYSPLMKVAQEIPTIGLQFSVHESTDEARDNLIPFKQKLTLQQIANMGHMFNVYTGRNPYFNFCAHDANSSEEDAERLLHMFNPNIWRATVSVVCERDENLPKTNQHQRDLATSFSQKLVQRGFDVRVFDPAGQDTIGGGCGQLWFVQQWMQNNLDKVRPSIGHGLVKLHAPSL